MGRVGTKDIATSGALLGEKQRETENYRSFTGTINEGEQGAPNFKVSVKIHNHKPLS